VVRTTIGTVQRQGSDLISTRASRPSLRGRFKSSKIKSGQGEVAGSPVGALSFQVGHQFHTIFHKTHPPGKPGTLKRRLHKEAVVVIGHEYNERFSLFSTPHPLAQVAS
jgi:hypothetical protein